jgi:uncharacterized protein (DUF2062 family)
VLTRIRQRLDRLAASDLDPGRTAVAIALGVFLSFSPFLGLQILLGLAAAFAFRLSRVAVLLGLCANLPWIMLPWYAFTTAAAAAAIGAGDGLDVRAGLTDLLSVPFYHWSFWERTGTLATALFWPFLLGPTIGSTFLSAAAYLVSFRMLAVRRGRAPSWASAAESSLGPASDAEQRAANRHVDDPQRARLEP